MLSCRSFYYFGCYGCKVTSAQWEVSDFILTITHVGKALQLLALIVTDHSIQEHPLCAVQLLGRHG